MKAKSISSFFNIVIMFIVTGTTSYSLPMEIVDSVVIVTGTSSMKLFMLEFIILIILLREHWKLRSLKTLG
ncbi:transmembrane protein, putative [Medicago truncatula]|uniref:Transmembrane protein, putative n=1 Tax=Medicago truncatula TaxID=3880 RepID=A0A072U770_MEDTR|nr:transmembrane protein, putative [Medicago truncatula]